MFLFFLWLLQIFGCRPIVWGINRPCDIRGMEPPTDFQRERAMAPHSGWGKP